MTFRFERAVEDNLGLPRNLAGGLMLGWGRPEDTEALAEFQGRIFAEGDEPDASAIAGVHDWMNGQHPTVGPGDFTLVTDENQGGKIVSSLNLISQIWAYDSISFGVGQVEAVGTDPEYRRRGLVRQQFEVVHARSQARGELMQVIGGIPWYYRQFGYEMGLAMQGERNLFWHNTTKLASDQTEAYRLRPATQGDIALLSRLYAIHCAASLVTQIRSETEWRYELTSTHPLSESHRRFFIVEEIGGGSPGYIEIGYYSEAIAVRELAVLPGHPLRLVCEFLTRALKILSDERVAAENKPEPFNFATFSLGTDHPGYTALGKQLGPQNLPYAWYVRIPDLPLFLHRIAPALDKRLQASVFDGYSGRLRLNFYRSHLTLTWERGKLTEIGTYTPETLEDGDAAFPDLTFLQLLLGYRSMTELERAYQDCRMYPDSNVKNQRTAALLNALFPQRSSSVAASG